ncbi:MAG: hypothetical protein MJ188_07270, partial [Treponema sp.]|nr:hypothetical protein [Treponema sp.]
MKKSITKKIWYFITLLFLLVACKNPLQAPSDKNDKLSEGKVKLKIAVDFADVNSRAASVSVEDEIAYYKTLSYTLLISKPDSDSGEQALLDGCTYEEVIAAGPSIEPGEWIFSMFARDEERDMPVLFGYCTKTISADDSFVELQLQPSSSLQGTIKIKVLYGSNYLTKDDEENTVYPEFDFKVLKTKIVEG